MFLNVNNCNIKRSFLLFLLLSPFFLYPHSVLSATVTYNYDSNQRLVSAKYDSGEIIIYSYDVMDNRLTEFSRGAKSTIYEDAEDSNILGWEIYDDDPSGAEINNIYDGSRASRVIEFIGSGALNAYRLRKVDGSNWDDTKYKAIQWSMRYDEPSEISIGVQTSDGLRYLKYTSADSDLLGNGEVIQFGLGNDMADGSWHTFSRDMASDLKRAQPGNTFIAILHFIVRGSGKVDDIKTIPEIPSDLDTDGDTITDYNENQIYRTNPNIIDSDGDGINDGDELAYWGNSLDQDSDPDGIISLLDPNSDNDGYTDGFEIDQGTNPADDPDIPTTVLYEDAENGNTLGWEIYDDNPSGSYIDNVYDNDKGDRVIEVSGDGLLNGFRLISQDGSAWDNTHHQIIEWSMKYTEDFVISIAVATTEGLRYLSYTPEDVDVLGSGTDVYHGFGGSSKDGSWKTYLIDLGFSLQEAQPSNNIQSLLGFYVAGNGWIDDIKTHAAIPGTQDSDGDGLTDNEEIGTYGSHPYFADSDGDGIEDGDEVAYWGGDWASDPDGDTLINLLDPDADGDGIDNGIEITQGTDPGDSSSYPTSALYEDAEDGNITGWEVYDSDPTGATIVNVYDDQRASRVVEFSGSATSNGYRLRNADGSYWSDTNFNVIEWSMRFDESFVIYIAAQTKDGFRYLHYTASDTDNLGTDTYVHHGLGINISDGTWQTINRDLELDLKEAQPDNELEAVLGFLIRGSGRVDDISTTQ